LPLQHWLPNNIDERLWEAVALLGKPGTNSTNRNNRIYRLIVVCMAVGGDAGDTTIRNIIKMRHGDGFGVPELQK
jgi:hypothetical protein